ncbi:BRAP2 RING ZnF UBP domain-containing protein 2-like [Anopheles merus]|uniref:BRAP2 RING ZnF UBP domain-containing protein 2-like n=1 Tax=Anopheles merus TaxID=30066 RepID=UPI001BE44014|nr:BRAP2 RING ZnF UBP domain-containing protein 2-like [Anopheles merus]XP_041786884.1 BRAP2 RING ZnF UBP domain-containing protein 2-like [Anopheles merus]
MGNHVASHCWITNPTDVLQLGTNRVWDYIGDNFVYYLLQNKSNGKLPPTITRPSSVWQRKSRNSK